MKVNFVKYIFIIIVISLICFAIYFIYNNVENEDKNKVQETMQEIEYSKEITIGISNYDNINPIVTNNKVKFGILTKSDIVEIKPTEISINDRYSTGSTISKNKIEDVFEIKELILKKELEDEDIEILDSIPKKDVSLKEIDDKIMTIDDFLDDFEV